MPSRTQVLRSGRRRTRRHLLRSAVSVSIALLISSTMLAGTHVPPAAAQEDLLSRLVSALENAGATVYEPTYDADTVCLFANTACEGWTVGFNYQGVGGSIEISGLRDEQQAKSGFDSTLLNTNHQSVSVNDTAGRTSSASTVENGISYSARYLWWQRGRYFVYSYLVQSTDRNALLAVDEIVDDVLAGESGAGGDGDASGDVADPSDAPGLSLTASPGSFTELGNTSVIRMTLSGPDVAGKRASITGHGQDANATTDAGGQAVFTVTHDDETLTEYRFSVACEGMTREVVVPVSDFDIRPEVEPGSGQPYVGVAADGRSALGIEIDLGSSTGGTLRVATPEIGTLSGGALGADGLITLSGGTGSIDYTPPAYLENTALTERIPVPASGGATLGSTRAAQTIYANSGSPYAVRVPLAFTHTTEDGRETEVVLDVLVSRAPVMLVHGFTGDKTTWSRLASYLAERGFDPVINEYYLGDQSIQDQARGLGTDVAREIDRYASLGLKLSRVDVVGHSMGGLISRDYTYGLPPHPDDVRKLIMVGTPNHGASFLDKSLGNIAAWGGPHSKASQQLYSGSAFLAQLNGGESVGRHLNPDMQYGNIYGISTDFVVHHTSAYLNGVTSHPIAGVTHSPAIPLPGVPITESSTVFDWIAEWLSSDIPRAPLRDTKARVVSGEGEVYISGLDENGETRDDLTAYPRDVEAWEQVGTGSDGRARVRLSVAGLAWGTIDLAPGTIIALGNVTPDAVTVRVRRGSARFRSLERNGGGHFEVVMGEMDPGEWMTLHPDAKVIGLDTDFVVEADGEGTADVLVLEGRARFDDGTTPAQDDMPVLGEMQAGAVGVSAGYESQLAQNQWWTDGFYRPTLLEVLQEWWAMFVSLFRGDGGVAPVTAAS